MTTLNFKAGAGKAAIHYPENFFPYRGFRGRKLLGVHDDIYARVLLMEAGDARVLIISLELGDITDEWARGNQRKNRCPCGSHMVYCIS